MNPLVPALILATTLATDVPDRRILTDLEHAGNRVLPSDLHDASTFRGATYGYDVDHVDLDLTVDFGTTSISGVSGLDVTITQAGLTELRVDLDDAFTVSSVQLDGSPNFFSHVGEVITIPLSVSPGLGASVEIDIAYSGSPVEVGNKGMRFRSHAGTPIVFTLSTPFSNVNNTVIPVSHYWRPCKDVPDDKSTVTQVITVPTTMSVCANGVQTSAVDNGNGTSTFTWAHGEPIAPYLINFAATNYVEINDTFNGLSGMTPIQHFAWPEDLADATSDWAFTPTAMGVLEGLFGAYPFAAEKYGMHEISPSHPAVENQTMASIPSTLVPGNGLFEWIHVHELSHMWWGDAVTTADWDHVWLNEGFATYCEALWRESSGGAPALQSYMDGLDTGPYAGTIIGPSYVWNTIVYNKGGWVLHMLRGIMGDTAFFAGMSTYLATYSGSNVLTDDFVGVMESAYGDDLSWFFDPWLQSEGRPAYEYLWSAEPLASARGGQTLTIDVEQTQSLSFPTYRMPIDVRVTTASGVETFVVVDSLRMQTFELTTADDVMAVVLDPDGWILADFTEVMVDTSPSFDPLAPPLAVGRNPFTVSTSLSVRVNRAGRAALRVFDTTGRLVRTLHAGQLAAGARTFSWDGRNEAGSGVASGRYVAQLVTSAGVFTEHLVLIR